MTRDERQSLSIKRWKAFQGKGTIEACTGYGKTWCALKIIKALVSKKPDLSIIIVVKNPKHLTKIPSRENFGIEKERGPV